MIMNNSETVTKAPELFRLKDPEKPEESNEAAMVFDLLRKGGRRLYVCEGPFDAMRVDYVSRIEGLPDRATCMFGVSYTQQQLTRLHCLAADYDELVILFDRVAMPQAIQLDQALSLGKSRIQTLQEGVKDPGELQWSDVIRLAGRNPTGANETLMDCVV